MTSHAYRLVSDYSILSVSHQSGVRFLSLNMSGPVNHPSKLSLNMSDIHQPLPYPTSLILKSDTIRFLHRTYSWGIALPHQFPHTKFPNYHNYPLFINLKVWHWRSTINLFLVTPPSISDKSPQSLPYHIPPPSSPPTPQAGTVLSGEGGTVTHYHHHIRQKSSLSPIPPLILHSPPLPTLPPL